MVLLCTSARVIWPMLTAAQVSHMVDQMPPSGAGANKAEWPLQRPCCDPYLRCDAIDSSTEPDALPDSLYHHGTATVVDAFNGAMTVLGKLHDGKNASEFQKATEGFRLGVRTGSNIAADFDRVVKHWRQFMPNEEPVPSDERLALLCTAFDSYSPGLCPLVLPTELTPSARV